MTKQLIDTARNTNDTGKHDPSEDFAEGAERYEGYISAYDLAGCFVGGCYLPVMTTTYAIFPGAPALLVDEPSRLPQVPSLIRDPNRAFLWQRTTITTTPVAAPIVAHCRSRGDFSMSAGQAPTPSRGAKIQACAC